jgi:hypothetical protein
LLQLIQDLGTEIHQQNQTALDGGSSETSNQSTNDDASDSEPDLM